jgi:hypothetical protein
VATSPSPGDGGEVEGRRRDIKDRECHRAIRARTKNLKMTPRFLIQIYVSGRGDVIPTTLLGNFVAQVLLFGRQVAHKENILLKIPRRQISRTRLYHVFEQDLVDQILGEMTLKKA